MSLQKVGKIIELFYSTSDGRMNPHSLSFDVKGVLKDKFYNTNVLRSVLIASLDSYELAKEHGIDAPYNSLGENILIDYNPYFLKPGAQIMIGDIVLEISQNCTICNSLAKVDAALPKILKDDRGIFAKVIQSGTIKQGDDVYLLTSSS